MELGDTDIFGRAESMRGFAMGTGDWISIVQRRASAVLDGCSGDRAKALAEVMDHLVANDLIQEKEGETLKGISERFFQAFRKKITGREAYVFALQEYAVMAASPGSTPAALAIGSAAVKALAPPTGDFGANGKVELPCEGGEQVVAFAQITWWPSSAGAGALAGAAVGAAVGGAAGGWAGAAIGAAVGAIAGALVGASNDDSE